MLNSQLQSLVASAVSAMNCQLVDCQLIRTKRNKVLKVYIDHAEGVSAELTAKVSRQIAAVLDVENQIQGHYTLEVSSPGLDRPLFRWEDYHRFLGRSIKLTLRAPREGGQRHYSGTLLAATAQQIEIETSEGNKISIAFREIEKARLIPEFV